MSHRPAKRRIAFGASLLLAVGIVVGVPAVAIVATPQAAEASVAAGEVVFVDSGVSTTLKVRHANGSIDDLVALADDDTQVNAASSPDGSRIAFDSRLSGRQHAEIYIANSDGSGVTELTTSPASGDPGTHVDWIPSWCGGQTLLFERIYDSDPEQVWKIDANSPNTETQVSLDDAKHYNAPQCSPDGTKIAFSRYNSSTGYSEIWYMNANGTSETKVPNQPSTDNDDVTWGSNSRLYFQSGSTTWIYGLDLTGSNGVQVTPGTTSDMFPAVSSDGSKVVYVESSDIYSRNSDGTGSATNLTNTSMEGETNPTFIKGTWPPTPPSNATVSVGAPSSSDAPYTRQMTVGLSATGVSKFQAGWSTSSSTAPNTSYLQDITNLTTKKGLVSYLGKYSGSGTTWNGGTQPDADWYLWVRSVQTGGTPNSWGTPLLVHTPKAPVWTGSGDSTSSGHHLSTDQPTCAIPLGCDPTGYVLNDAAFSWVTGAASNYNTTVHVPSAWQITPLVLAISGKPTSEFGAPGETPGSVAWASQNQANQLNAALYPRYNSWNVLSMTGGANDTTWADVMAQWYIDHTGVSYGPWAVPTGSILNCPNTEAVWQDLHTGSLGGVITSNLQGLVTVATNASPGVRVVDVDYPYPVDTGTQTTGNPCYANWVINGDTYHGAKSVIDEFHGDHAAVTGSNVKHADLRSAFGTTNTVTNGYLQLTRLYGYPHWSGGTSGGQAMAATTAANIATGSGW